MCDCLNHHYCCVTCACVLLSVLKRCLNYSVTIVTAEMWRNLLEFVLHKCDANASVTVSGACDLSLISI